MLSDQNKSSKAIDIDLNQSQIELQAHSGEADIHQIESKPELGQRISKKKLRTE